VDHSSPTIIQCSFITNQANRYGGAIYASGSSNPTITNCDFIQNKSNTANGGAIYFRDNHPIVSNCLFDGNSAQFAGGAVYTRNSDSTISPGNTFTNNIGCAGVDLAAWSESVSVNATNNTFSGSAESEYYVLPLSVFDVSGHISQLPTIHSDLYVSEDGDNLLNTGLSPSSPFQTIRYALSRIQTNSIARTIHLAAGTFSSETNNEVFPLPLLSDIIIQGDSSTSIVSGNSQGCFRCFFAQNTQLDNLTISGNTGPGISLCHSSGLFSNLTVHDFCNTSYGAAFHVDDSDIHLTNSTISNCNAAISGGAVYLDTMTTRITNCRFENNSAVYSGGAIHNYSGNSIFEACTFNGNTSPAGGAVRIANGNPSFYSEVDAPNIFENNFSPRGANLSSQNIPAIPYNAQGNSFDVTPDSAWSVAPVSAFNTDNSTITGSAPLPGATVFVSESGDNDNSGLSWETSFRTISYAVKRVTGSPDAPATINIGTGIFNSASGENFPIPLLPSLILQGIAPEQSVINSGNETCAVAYFSSDSILRSVTITSNTSSGIVCENSSTQFDNLIIEDCDSYSNGAGILISAGTPSIESSILRRNHSFRQGGAIHVSADATVDIHNCQFLDNLANQHGGAILSGYNSHTNISDCEFQSNNAGTNGGAVAAFFGTIDVQNSTFRNNTARKTGGAVFLDSENNNLSGSQNLFSSNSAAIGADLAADDIFSFPVPAMNNRFPESIPESAFYVAPQDAFDLTGYISSFEPIQQNVYVSPSGSDENSGLTPAEAFRTIRYALSKVLADDQQSSELDIILAEGNYVMAEEENPGPYPLLDNINIRGISAEETIVQADTVEGVFKGLFSKNSAITDLTIRDSFATAIDLYFSDFMIDRCILISNGGNGSGGAIAASGGQLCVVDTEFISNSASSNGGAIDIRQYASFLLSGSDFYNNFAGGTGGAVATWLTNGRAYDCFFDGNSSDQGGAWSSRNSTFYLTGSKILNNTADKGGGIFVQQGEFSLVDCLIAENMSSPVTEINSHGGGIYFDNCSARVESCTVTANKSVGFSRVTGGGITAIGNSDLSIINSIVRYNDAVQGKDMAIGFPWSSADVFASYSNLSIQDHSAIWVSMGSSLDSGEGIIEIDPLLLPDNNWQLSSICSGQTQDSPCIDSGSESALSVTYLTPFSIENMGVRSSETGLWPDQDTLDIGWHSPPSDCIHDGDINSDGVISWEDIELIFWMAFDPLPLNYEDICVADINFDAEITVTDAQILATQLSILSQK